MKNLNNIELIPLKDIPLIRKGDNLTDFLIKSASAQDIGGFRQNDILVVCHTIISKARGYVADLNEIQPGRLAKEIANGSDVYGYLLKEMDPRHIQLILDNSKSIVRMYPFLITETVHGFICANSGVDKSNIEDGNHYAFLPPQPDEEAEKIRSEIKEKTNYDISVIISDSHGRPFRMGSVGVAIGISGLDPLIDFRGKKDLYGHTLKSSQTNVADELACAAQLLMGESDEGIPAVIIRGFIPSNFNFNDSSIQKSSIQSVIHPDNSDIFKQISGSDLLKSRRSFKSDFSKREIEVEKVNYALNMIQLSPSAHNSQPWKYFWIKNHELRKRLVESMSNKWSEDLKGDGMEPEKIKLKIFQSEHKFLSAPLFFISALDESKLEIDSYADERRKNAERILGIQSVSASIMYFILALKTQRIDSCWYSAGVFASDSIIKTLDEELKKNSNKENLKIQAIILAGYVDSSVGEDLIPDRPKRNPMENYIKIL